jgi:streptogrisin B
VGSHRRVRGLVAAAGLITAFLSFAPAAEAAPAPLAASVTGGDPIYGVSSRCTATVNVTNGSAFYFVTAGSCGNVEPTWYTADGIAIGTTVDSSFPGDDGAVVQYVGGVSHPGTVGSQDVSSAADATVGEHVCMRGGVSGVLCGTVSSLDNTVQFPEGTVFGLIQTDICAQPGDTGAVLYDGTKVLGILSGVSGGCEAYFQPITEILNRYGVSVY